MPIAASLLMLGCSHITVTDSGCAWTRIITISHKDVLTRTTAEEIEEHNRTREEICK